MITKMKKNYNEPQLNVLHIGKEICTQDIIVVSNQMYGSGVNERVYAPGQRGLDDWDAGY